MTMVFSEMVKTQNIGEVTKADLRALSLDQLEAFARLLGIAYSGDKNKRVQRIFDALSVRYFLLESDDPKYYENRYSRQELVKQVKKIGTYIGSTKYGLAVGRLNWRIKCRREGQKFYNEMRAEIAEQPRQIKLF